MCTSVQYLWVINLLKPTGHVMHQQFIFNNCTFCPQCIYVFCIYLRTNSDLCHLHHKLFGFYNREKSVYCAVRTGSLNKGFCIYLRTNSDLCHLQHKLTGFYNRDEKCLLRGTNWIFN